MRPTVPAFRHVALAASLSILLVTVGAGTSMAAGPRAVGWNAATVSGAGTVSDTIDYWTPQRMQSATPMDLAVPAGDASSAGFAERPTGEPGSVPASSHGKAQASTSAVAGTSAVTGTAYDYPYPFTRYNVPHVLRSRFPYRAIGKIFFTLHGFDFVCSGASVAGGPRQIVFTAGHCVNDGNGGFATHLVFVPGYFKGRAPYGIFPAKQIWTTPEWNSGLGSAFSRDFAAFSVGRNARRQRLRKVVGYLGFAWNQASPNGIGSRDLHWDLFGYPASSPFHGRQMIVCEASHAVDDTTIGDPAPVGVGCDMTGGSSGGPWILGLRSDNFLNGVDSYKYGDAPLAMYSPYFDDEANLIRCAAATNSTTPPATC